MIQRDLFAELIQDVTGEVALGDLLEEQALTLERNLLLFSDAAQKYEAMTGKLAAWTEKDIAYLERRCRMLWFLRKYTWILMR